MNKYRHLNVLYKMGSNGAKYFDRKKPKEYID
jgi:hypothetical protein